MKMKMKRRIKVTRKRETEIKRTRKWNMKGMNTNMKINRRTKYTSRR